MDLKHYIRPGKGASDISPLLANAAAFNELVKRLSALFSDIRIDKVVCIEGRGFILGAAVAYELKTGLILVRALGKSKNVSASKEYLDYSGKKKKIELQYGLIKKNEKILLIDDWMETGETIKTAISLIEAQRGIISGIGVFMDDTNSELKKWLKKYNYEYLETVKDADNF